MAVKQLTEQFANAFTGSKVDREKGTIADVLICGTRSENGRDYPPEVLRRDFAVYEGRPVNADHGQQATISRRLGWFSNVAPAADGRPRGTFNVLKSHPLASQVFEAAERNPALFGFSHVIQAETRLERGREVIEAIKACESIDLVADPATTKGFWESKGGAVKTTIKQLVERLAAKGSVDQILKVRRLAEMDDGAMGDVPVDPAPAESADPDEAIDSAFASAMHAQVDAFIDGNLELPELLSKLKELAKAHGNVSDGGDSGGEGGGGGGEGDDSPKEGKKPAGSAILEALDVAEKVGLRPDRDDLELIASAAPARREAVAKKLKAAAEGREAADRGERPRSAGRQAAGKIERKAEGKEPEAIPDDPKKFKDFITEG